MSNPRHTEHDEDPLLPIGSAAKALGISIDTLRRWENRGLISAVRTPTGQRRFRQSELDELLGAGK